MWVIFFPIPNALRLLYATSGAGGGGDVAQREPNGN